MERREFFKGLIASGATVREREHGRNRRARHVDNRIYHGPMLIPERVAAIIAAHPAIKRTTHRHLVSRYAEGNFVWIFRCQIPASLAMVGEIVSTSEGKIRVHCWSAATPADTYCTPKQLLQMHLEATTAKMAAETPEAASETSWADALLASPIIPPKIDLR